MIWPKTGASLMERKQHIGDGWQHICSFVPQPWPEFQGIKATLLMLRGASRDFRDLSAPKNAGRFFCFGEREPAELRSYAAQVGGQTELIGPARCWFWPCEGLRDQSQAAFPSSTYQTKLQESKELGKKGLPFQGSHTAVRFCEIQQQQTGM